MKYRIVERKHPDGSPYYKVEVPTLFGWTSVKYRSRPDICGQCDSIDEAKIAIEKDYARQKNLKYESVVLEISKP